MNSTIPSLTSAGCGLKQNFFNIMSIFGNKFPRNISHKPHDGIIRYIATLLLQYLSMAFIVIMINIFPSTQDKIRRTIMFISCPIFKPITTAISSIYNTSSTFLEYTRNKESIADLQIKNQNLENELFVTKMNMANAISINELQLARAQKNFYKYTSARVMSYETGELFAIHANLLEPDDAPMIEIGSIVMESEKLVGKVISVSKTAPFTVKIELATNSTFFIPVISTNNSSYYIIKGSGNRKTMQFLIPSEKFVDLEEESPVFVANISELNLPEALVGKVVRSKGMKYIQTSANLSKLKYIDITIPNGKPNPKQQKSNTEPLQKIE